MTDKSNYRNNLNTVCQRNSWNQVKDTCRFEGPQHNPTWIGKIFVNNTPYEGKGGSQDKAYEEAAKNALYDLKKKHPAAVPDEFLK